VPAWLQGIGLQTTEAPVTEETGLSCRTPVRLRLLKKCQRGCRQSETIPPPQSKLRSL
jgi:hypothetical protein